MTSVDLTSGALTDLLFDERDVGRCLVAPDGTVLRANAEWLRSTGFTLDQVVGEDIVELFPATRDMALAMHARVRAGHRVDVPRHAQTVNGRETWWVGSIAPVPMQGGTGLLITAREVRGEEQEHSALAAQRQLALDAAQMGWWHYDPVTRVATYDRRYTEIFGVSGDHRANAELLKLIHPQDLPAVWRAVEAALDPVRRQRYSAEYRVLRPDGDLRWVEAHGVAIFEGEGASSRATSLVGTVQDVTDRKRVAESLRESTALLRAISDTSVDVIFAKDRAGRIRFANPATLALIGKPLAQVLGHTDAELLGDVRAAREVMENDRRVMERGIPADLEERVPLPDGTERVWFSRKVPYRDDTGAVVGLLGISRDVTEARRAERALRESEVKFRTVFEQAAIGIGRVSFADARWIDVNDAFCRMLGRSREELLRLPWTEITHPDDLELDLLSFGRMARGELETYSLEKRFLHADGHHVWARLTLSLVRDERQRPAYEIAIIEDISAQRRAQAELETRDAQFRALVGELYSGVALIDAGGKFLVVNRRFLEMFGLPSDAEVRNVNDQDWGRWEVLDERGRALELDDHPVRRAALTRTAVRNELVEVRAPGAAEPVWMTVSAEPLLDAGGSVVQIICTYHDVTDRRRAEEELRRSEAALEAFFASSPGILNLEDDEFRYVKTDPITPTYFGLTRESIVGKPLAELAPGFIAEFGPMMRRVLETGEPALHQEVHSPVPGRPGEVTHWRASYFPVPLPGGRRGLGIMGVEVTDLMKAEAALRELNEQLRDSDRRKTEFLGVLSHELRNPLAPIRNSVYLLERAATGSPQAARAQQVIRRQTEHLARLIDDLLDVTRISRGKIVLKRTRLDLRDVIRKAADDMHALFEEAGIVLRVEYSFTPAWAEIDSTRMSQVIGNLLQNALKFTPSGGEVAVVLAAHDGAAEISVRDEGIGIDPAELERIFEPFAQAEQDLARTKGGLGLGLALVKGLVELHGGTVAARSEGIGRGADFRVRLPLAAAASGVAADPGAQVAGAPLVVLVIEDHADAAQSLADLLELSGHQVRVARDGRSGIALARELRPDVVLCDIGLPDLTGYEVAEQLRGLEPGRSMRLVAVSGYARPEDRQRAREAGFDAHVAKPPDFDELMSALVR